MKNKDDIFSVISFYLRYASTVKVVFIIFAIITFIASLIMIDESDSNSLFGIPISIALVGEGIILCNNFKWKAYILQNTYETNEANSKKK